MYLFFFYIIFCSLFLFSMLLFLYINTSFIFLVLIPIFIVGECTVCCINCHFSFMVPFPLVLWYLKLVFLGKNRNYKKYGLKLRSPGEFVCSAKHLGATETDFNYGLEGSLISDHKPWGLTSDDELEGGSDLAPCHPAPNSQVPPAHFSSRSSARFWPERASGFTSSPLATGSFQSPEFNRTLMAKAGFCASFPYRFPVCTSVLAFCRCLLLSCQVSDKHFFLIYYLILL